MTFHASLESARKLTNQVILGTTEQKEAIAKHAYENQKAILEAAAELRGEVYDPAKSKNACFSRIISG